MLQRFIADLMSLARGADVLTDLLREHVRAKHENFSLTRIEVEDV